MYQHSGTVTIATSSRLKTSSKSIPKVRPKVLGKFQCRGSHQRGIRSRRRILWIDCFCRKQRFSTITGKVAKLQISSYKSISNSEKYTYDDEACFIYEEITMLLMKVIASSRLSFLRTHVHLNIQPLPQSADPVTTILHVRGNHSTVSCTNFKSRISVSSQLKKSFGPLCHL